MKRQELKKHLYEALTEHHFDLFNDDLFFYSAGCCEKQPISSITSIILEMRKEYIEKEKSENERSAE